MDQRTICLYLNRKGLSAQAIHDELVQVRGSDVVAYSMVTFYLRASSWRAQNKDQHSDPPPDVIDNAILQALNQTPFASVWKLVKFMCISRATVWRRLTGFLGFVVKHLHWPRYPPGRCTTTNSNRSVKRIAQTLRMCTGQWLAKFYDLGWALIWFVDKLRKSLGSSGSATSWKGETHDLIINTLRAVFANWVEQLNWLLWTKVITIDNLNNGIFSFVSFSSQAVMLRSRETPYRM
jgi:hypothetical protein